MRGRGGGAAGAAALFLGLIAAACAAPKDTAPGESGADTTGATDAAADDGDSAGSILGLSKEQLLVEVEAGTGRTAIVRKPDPPAAALEAPFAAGADAEEPAEPEADPERPERAARDAESARELAEARRELGLALERVGDIAGAVSELEAALAAQAWAGPPDKTPWGDLVRICRRGEPAEPVARACARAFASTRFAPGEMAELIALRGDANARLGRTSQAVKDYANALRIDSSHYRALLGRARLRIRSGQSATALNDLRLAIETGPRPAEARLARARAYEALGRFDRAVADYDAVLADIGAVPLEPVAWRGRARAHCAIGRAEAAAVDWRLWADSVPGGAGYVQEMLRARGYLRARWRERLDPTVIAGLRGWTEAGCP